MQTAKYIMVIFFALCLALPSAAIAGKGYMGGKGDVVVAEEPADTGGSGGVPDTVEGPLNDKMSDSGKLFGDLYRILRQTGVSGDQKLVPEVNAAGEPVLTDGVQLFVTAVNNTDTPDAVVGGEPVLTVIDPGVTNAFADYGWYAAEIGVNPDETPIYGAAQSPYPAQCVQPVANYSRWGDISSKTGLSKNRLPLVITYDATWGRSECAVGQLDGEVTANSDTGELTIPINPWFIEPGGTWTDPNNGEVTYVDGVLWTDLVEEVGFGRLNISRSPEAVLQSSFDEAINNINSPDTIAIELDAAGRLLLTKNVYDELLVDKDDADGDGDTSDPLLIGTVKKAIDSPLENVALYVKLMQDGHLVTPGDERAPLDRSKNGGIPIWKMIELTDGPGAKALRPTIDIAKLQAWGMGNLVDVSAENYLTYYVCLNDAGTEVPCMIWGTDPSPEVTEPILVGNPAAVSRELVTVPASGGCPVSVYDYSPYVCEGPFNGIMADDGRAPEADDLKFAAAAFAAAADKTGHISVDMLVYLNSILGINQVLGQVLAEDGTVLVDYEKNPVYFNYSKVAGYDRSATFKARGQVVEIGGTGSASTYDGNVTVLQGGELSGTWTEDPVVILNAEMGTVIEDDQGIDVVYETIFDNLGLGDDAFPNKLPAAENILGFTQQADDNLSVIRFIHTYQIPSLR